MDNWQKEEHFLDNFVCVCVYFWCSYFVFQDTNALSDIPVTVRFLVIKLLLYQESKKKKEILALSATEKCVYI